MKRAAIGFAAVSLVCLLSMGHAFAEEQAATAQLPAALQAIQSDSQPLVLTQQQAQQVRGEGYYWVSGAVAVHNYVANGIAYIQADQPLMVNTILTSWQFGIQIQP